MIFHQPEGLVLSVLRAPASWRALRGFGVEERPQNSGELHHRRQLTASQKRFKIS